MVISTQEAKSISADWHDGQTSQLYQFASSGIYLPHKHNKYLSEIDKREKITIDKIQLKKLKNLKNYFNYQAEELLWVKEC